jgi:hypothetical protein
VCLVKASNSVEFNANGVFGMDKCHNSTCLNRQAITRVFIEGYLSRCNGLSNPTPYLIDTERLSWASVLLVHGLKHFG